MKDIDENCSSRQYNVNEKNACPEKKDGMIKDDIYQLVERAQRGDVDALEKIIRRFSNQINGKASLYFIAGADRDDVIQEAMIGLYKAIITYAPGGGANFYTYANLCMKHQLLDAIRSANREKHVPLNTSVSINKTVTDNKAMGRGGYDETTLEETLEGNVVFEMDIMKVIDESIDAMKDSPQALSEIEAEVWKKYALGMSYEEIGEGLGKNIKSVYNTMARVKKKILSYINE